MIADDIYKTFLKTVVAQGVFSEGERARDIRPLSEKNAKDILEGKRVDHRLPWLARMSGKGGRDAKGVLHTEWHNVSLLEHVASVVRGALVFAEHDLWADDPTIDPNVFSARLAKIAAVAFLHDADKMAQISRTELVSVETVETLMKRYHVPSFLDAFGVGVTPAWMLAMIDSVEVSRGGRIATGGVSLSPSDRNDAAYARIADRMDGLYLRGGVEAALSELAAFEGFRTNALRNGWLPLILRQPQFPFLLDALQISISNACQAIGDLPPLIESHQDGQLVVVVPEVHADAIVEAALHEMRREFGAAPRVDVNTRLAIDLLDGRADPESLRDALADPALRGKALAMSKRAVLLEDSVRGGLEEALDAAGATISWPNADKVGATFAPLPGLDDDHHREVWTRAAMLVVGMRCCPSKNPVLAKRTKSEKAREIDLVGTLQSLGVDIPSAILGLNDGMTRLSALALFAATKSLDDADLEESLFGPSGVLAAWFEGDTQHAGINARIPDDAVGVYLGPIRDMVEQSRQGRFHAGNEEAIRRCHFTAAPVHAEKDLYVSLSEGVYGLKRSAFSGREGRPENHRSSAAVGTWISPLARAEHHLRFRRNGRGAGDLPFFISSPTTTGLFASLTLGRDTEIVEISTYELRKVEAKKVAVPFTVFDTFSKRIHIGRFESQEIKLADVLDMVLRLVEAARRSGRAIHVFQGLPYEVRDRVYFDALPHEIERGLGKRGFRLEELDELHRNLQTWTNIARTQGLGVTAATAIMDPATRLEGLCLAVSALDRIDDPGLFSLKMDLLQQAKEIVMTDSTHSPIVRFARAMTGYQRALLGGSSGDSRSVQERGMRLAIEAIDKLGTIDQADRETIICAVVAAIDDAANRESDKKFVARREDDPSHREALTRAAEIFADEVWPLTFKGRSPASRARASAIGIYRVAFDRAHQMRKAGDNVFPLQ